MERDTSVAIIRGQIVDHQQNEAFSLIFSHWDLAKMPPCQI
jgi:hypothetical protein